MAAGSWPSGDPAAVVRAIIAQPAYGRSAPTRNVKQLTIWDAIGPWFDHYLWGPLRHALHAIGAIFWAGRGVSSVAGIAIDVAIVAFLVFLIVRTAYAFAVGRRGQGGATVVRGARLPEGAGAPRDWRAAAREAAARGDFAAAIAALFRVALALLDERGVVAFDGARTPGEYRRLVRREREAALVAFDRLAERFVRATYASAPSRSDDYEAAERALGELEPALGP